MQVTGEFTVGSDPGKIISWRSEIFIIQKKTSASSHDQIYKVKICKSKKKKTVFKCARMCVSAYLFKY